MCTCTQPTCRYCPTLTQTTSSPWMMPFQDTSTALSSPSRSPLPPSLASRSTVHGSRRFSFGNLNCECSTPREDFQRPSPCTYDARSPLITSLCGSRYYAVLSLVSKGILGVHARPVCAWCRRQHAQPVSPIHSPLPDDDHAGDLARQPRRPECTRRRRLKVALDAPEKKEKKSRAQPMLTRGPVPTRAARVKNPFLETGWWQHAARVAHPLVTNPRTTCIFFKVFLSFAKTPRGFPNKTC